MDISKADIVKKSMVGAVINGVVNAGIAAHAFFKHFMATMMMFAFVFFLTV